MERPSAWDVEDCIWGKCGTNRPVPDSQTLTLPLISYAKHL